jgi:RNAse (barnase) inhibitor barstar
MNYEQLFQPEQPTFYVQVADESSLANLYFQLTSDYPQAAIRMVRGNKSKTVPDFFNEIGAALQFPYYFGENWDAFDECITDLSWLDGDAYLLIVNQANLLLQDATQKDFQILMQVLSDAHETWLRQPQIVNEEEQPTAFHLLLACTDEHLSAFSQRLTDAGVEFHYVNP